MIPNWLLISGTVLGIALGYAASQIGGPTGFAKELWAFVGVVVGAGLTVIGALAVVMHQARTREKEAKEARRRQQLGARAILTSDLGQISKYAKDSAATVMRGNGINEGEVKHEVIACPELGPEILLRLQRLVELLYGDESDQVVDLMQISQIQRARLIDLIEWLNNPARRPPYKEGLYRSDFTFAMRRTVELHLRVDAMYSFARQQQETITSPPFQEQAVDNSLRVLGVDRWFSPEEHCAILKEMAGLPSVRPLR